VAGLLSVEEARDRVLAAAPGPLRAERVPVVTARGRVLAAAVVAATDLPPWDNSAMDGYAIRAADVAAAEEHAPVRLAVIGEVAAGRAPDRPVAAGGALRIATGAPLPPGADAVVAVELTTPLDAGGNPGQRGRDALGPVPAAVLVHVRVGPGANVRRRASDLRAGATVLEPGSAIGPAEVAVVAGAGVPDVMVHRRPRVAVISTGDELRPAGTDLGPAGIPDANGPALVALCAAAGADARHVGIAPDDLDEMTRTLREAILDADMVIVSGGVSVGPYDVVRPAFEAVGKVDLWRVAVQPGKPFAFGTAARPLAPRSPARPGAGAQGEGGTPAGQGAGPVLLVGLPGNPVSTFVTFELFVRPVLRRLAGRPDWDLLRPTDRGVLEEPVSKASGRRAFIRVAARRARPGESPLRDAQGRVRLGLAGGQGSHVLSALAASDALAIVPESVDELPAGAPVELWWLDRP
jgi:molybdopterin molybdotransferase